MRLLILHDIMNPQREIPIDADDFSAAAPFGQGSAVRIKSGDTPLAVHETPEQIIQMIRDLS